MKFVAYITIFVKGVYVMCVFRLYEIIYEYIQKLNPEETLQLVLEAETE